ncbi:hypothetical protein ASZ90_012375 [hydrocarbon metagenome]|uniref:Uncharacterized protein n=1 Tax=hydrocarbon metagenome TaxID=938273 RepID=A0A0W8FAK2_9ZZZZ
MSVKVLGYDARAVELIKRIEHINNIIIELFQWFLLLISLPPVLCNQIA